MERRFAILIGINNYKKDPLDYCVKDVEDVKKILIETCKFDKNDIRAIISSDKNAIASIFKMFEKALTSIFSDFKNGEDSIFFYYSGHGKQYSVGTILKFHDDEISLKQILDKINDCLNPKHEFYVIDSCYSGEKIRGDTFTQDEQNIFTANKFSFNSESFNILTASRYDQPATEKRKFQNGTLTHYFLKSINCTENYNHLGFLSPDIISNKVIVNVSLEKDFEQIPYSLSKNSGTYPFAFKENLKEAIEETNNVKDEPRISDPSTVHFHYRMQDSFPGVRGIEWFKDNDAINGLNRFFETPITFDDFKGHGVVGDPIWWFRGTSAHNAYRFERLTEGKMLFNTWELKIHKVGIYNGTSYWNNVIYLQTYPDDPTKLCQLTEKEIKMRVIENGSCSEYFGWSEGKILKAEYAQDGAAIIDGKYSKLKNPEVRRRFLSPYNFILVAKFSPANTRKGNLLGVKYMNEILKGNATFEEFIEEYEKLPKHNYD